MELVVIGANHKSTPLAVRERLSLSTREQNNLLSSIKSNPDLKEGVVLSTCNRTEIYLIADDRSNAEDFTLTYLSQTSHLEIEELRDYIYIHCGPEGIKHLYQVASGIDSLVIGEDQILGQIKDAFQRAKRLKVVEGYLHRLFTEALRVGKRARTETKINCNAASVSYAAVELARKIFGSLSGETVLILGAGETSELTLKSLVDYGVKGVIVANRTYERGKELAARFNGEAVTWDHLEDWLRKVDIIIASTAAPHYVLHYKMIKEAMQEKRGPLFLIDIAIPRDIEPEVNEIPGVHLYDLDDLESVVEENLTQRKEEVEKVEKIIDEEVVQFKKWLKTRQCVPVIKQIRQKAEEIKEEEVRRALKQLSSSNAQPEEIISSLAHRLVNRLLHAPTIGIKALANSDGDSQKIEVIRELFIGGKNESLSCKY